MKVIKEPNVINDDKLVTLARKISKENFAERVVEVDKHARFPKENIQDLKDNNLLNIGLPQNPASIKCIVNVIEEIAQGCPSTAIVYVMHISLLPSLYQLSSDLQKETFLKPVFDGQKLGTYSQSEKTTGSRAWYMESFADKDDSNYILDCFKSFSCSSGHTDFYSVVTRDSKEATPNELSLFFVNPDNPNIKKIGEWDAMGLRGSSSTPIFFDKVKIPHHYKIGEDNINEDTFSIIMAYTFPIYAIGLSAAFYGVAKLAYEEALKHVSKRKYMEGGKSAELKELGVMQKYFAEMKLKLDTNKVFLDHVAGLADENLKTFNELIKVRKLHKVVDEEHDKLFSPQSQLKILSCETAIEVTNIAMQVMGGSGYKRGSIIERCYRDARAGSLMNPSNDVLKMILGRREFGMKLPWDE